MLGFRVSLLAALAAGACLVLAAQDEAYVKRGALQRQGRGWVEEAECGAAVREGGRLVLRADVGSAEIKPGRNDRMECKVRLGVMTSDEAEAKSYLSRVELSVRRLEGGSVSLTARFPGERRRLSPVSFDVRIPLRFNVDLETKGGGVDVEKLEGELRAATAGGDIHTGDVTGPVRVETAGGGIVLGNIGQRLEAHTAGGSIRVGNVRGDVQLETSGGEISAGLIEGTVRAETAGGDITLRGTTGPVIAETAGGQIRIGESGSSVRAETAGGSIHLRGARGRVQVETAGGSIDLFQLQGPVRAATVAGRILAEISASRQTFAASDLEATAGDVQVFLPADLPLNIDAVIDEAAGHKILSDFPLTIQGDGQAFAVHSVRGQGSLNGGGEVLRIRTTMGNIEIRKLDSRALEQLKLRQETFWKHWDVRRQELEERLREKRERLERLERDRE